MTKRQTAKVNMLIAMILFFDKYTTVFADFAQLVTEITGFKGSYNSLQLEIGKQGLKISGVVTTKDTNLDTAIKLTVKSARKARAWAKNTGNATLEALFDVQVSTFSDMTQSVVINSLTTIETALSTNIGSLTGYKVVAADVAAISTAIGLATTDIGTPKQAITTRAVATGQIEVFIDECDAYLEIIDDLLVPEYEDTDAEMVEAYHLSRTISSLGNKATGLKVTNTNAATGALLEGVTVTIVEVARSAISNISGLSLIDRMKPGTYHVTCKKVGFVDFDTIIEFALGKISVLAVAMRAI